MTEQQLITRWNEARWHLIVSQLAPTFLLAVTIWLLVIGLAETSLPVRIAAAGVLLASGILGAVVQISAAREAAAASADLLELATPGALAAVIAGSARFTGVVRYVTPAVFVIVYIALLWALFLPG